MSKQNEAPAPSLDHPIQYLKGVGPARAADFALLDVRTIGDLLTTFPRRIDDRRNQSCICELRDGDETGLRVHAKKIRTNRIPGGRQMTTVTCTDGTGTLEVIWFNMSWIEDRFAEGREVFLFGKIATRNGRLQMRHPAVEPIAADGSVGRMVPVYPCAGGLSQALWVKAMTTALEQYGPLLTDIYPNEFIEKRGIMPRLDAIRAMHFPTSPEETARARERLVYDECLLLQLALMLRRRGLGREAGRVFSWNEKIDARIRALFPFRLTDAQSRTVDEIVRDMQSPHPMHRLLQGDVGSGKTAVSVYALLLAVANKTQAVIMAPTEILARQHDTTLRDFLAQSDRARVKIGLLLGGMKVAERRTLLASLAGGTTDILIATHAAIQDDVSFRDLGLVVIDEQHKFGVEQRALLKAKGTSADMLVMTATPIPRSLALTLYGDLDVSTIDAMPPGRLPVRTHAPLPEEMPKVWDFLRRELTRGRQAYIVSPLVEESEQLDLKSATELFEELGQTELKSFRLGLLHGKMTRPEQSQVMDDFRNGKIDVLVSTVVIEVGVSVTNATVMTIIHAERFGLAQLHQLRGRIARGTEQGHCILVSDTKNPESRARLDILVEEHDGFRIAEEDLRLRGEGEFLGTRQHGHMFRLASIVDDFPVLVQARDDAQRILKDDPLLAGPTHMGIRDEMLRLYAKRLDLTLAG